MTDTSKISSQDEPDWATDIATALRIETGSIGPNDVARIWNAVTRAMIEAAKGDE